MNGARVVPALSLACLALPIARVTGNVGLALHGGRTSHEVVRNAFLAANAAELLGALFAGVVAARYGGRNTLLGALFALAVSSLWAVVWVPPAALIGLFALGGLARVAAWCAIVAVIAETREIERARVLATALAAAVAAGWVIGSLASAFVGTSALGFGVPAMLLGIGLLVRATLQVPSRVTEARAGSGYRDVEVIEHGPQPVQRAVALLKTPTLLAALVVVFAIAASRSVGSLARDLQSTRALVVVPAAALAAILAMVIVRSPRFLVLGVAAPLAVAAALSVTFVFPVAILIFLFAVTTSVASTVVAGSLPFVVGRDREGAPIVAGFASAAATLGSTAGIAVPGTGAAFVASFAASLVALVLALWLARSTRG